MPTREQAFFRMNGETEAMERRVGISPGEITEQEERLASQSTGAPAIAAVICTYNRYDLLPHAIASLEKQILPSSALEILIVDNSADLDAQREFWDTHSAPKNGRVLFDTVPGLSRARNTATRAARAPIIAYMDDDAIAEPEWCSSIVGAFKELPDAGAVGGPVEPIWPGEEPPWLHKWQRGFFTIVDHGDERRALGEKEWLAGTNIAFRRADLEQIGGFHESLGRIGASLLSNEELSVAAKLKEMGRVPYYEPGAKVLHRVHSERVSQQWLRRRVAWQVISDLLSGTPKMQSEVCWSRLAEYLRQLPPEMRGVRGLFLDGPDSDLFYKQCEALEAVLYLALNDGKDPEA